jgi:hypothetical protein
MKNLEFYEKQFQFELEGRNRMHTLLQIPFALLVSAVSVAAALLKDYKFLNTFLDWMFIAFCAFWCYFIYKSIQNFSNCFHGHLYHALPLMNTLHNRYEQNLEYYSNLSESGDFLDFDPRDETDNQFKKELLNYYVNATTHNAQINAYRGDQWHTLVQNIAGLALITAFSYLWFHVCGLSNNSSTAKPTYSIHSEYGSIFHGMFYLEKKDVAATLETQEVIMTNKPPPPPPPTEAPPIRVIKENGQVPPPRTNPNQN